MLCADKFLKFWRYLYDAHTFYKMVFSQKDVFDGWNFGAQIGLSFMFEISDDFSVGINYNGQSDLSDFEKNNNFGLKNTPISGIADKQKMKNLNSLGIIFKLKL